MSVIGLAGLAGAVTAQRAGRLHDRGWSLPATGAAYALAVVAFVVAAFCGRSVAGTLVAVVLLDIAVQGANILNQSRVLACGTAIARCQDTPAASLKLIMVSRGFGCFPGHRRRLVHRGPEGMASSGVSHVGETPDDRIPETDPGFRSWLIAVATDSMVAIP